jgi:hypothetical protein
MMVKVRTVDPKERPCRGTAARAGRTAGIRVIRTESMLQINHEITKG